ncbi:MAG: monothiol glutaredoxin, Grx4 family [Coxiella sp. (in: Bacteria)]|nr:MAG: monothiol glutaredoxin, Grx4 family [Coxiella sp. (in: g-proteobacteria)]
MSIHEQIDELVKNNDVVLFMKGTPDFPQCGFSGKVAHILRQSGVTQYASVNVLEDPDMRQGIKEYSQWPTVPQLYVKGEFVGGCDIVSDLYEKDQLAALLK